MDKRGIMDIIENELFYREAVRRMLIDCIKEILIVKPSGIMQCTDIDDEMELNPQPVISDFDQKCIDKYSKEIVFTIANEATLARQSEIIRILNSNTVKGSHRNILERRLEFIGEQRIRLDQEFHKD